MFDQQVLDALARPLDPDRVKSRRGGAGKSLSYIEAHDAIRTANTIFGPGNWGYRVQSLEYLGQEPVENNGRKGFRVAYGAVVEVELRQFFTGNGTSEFVRFSDTGYGDAVEYTGSALTPQELARKEAVSDALKRALKNLGDQFGFGLYGEEGRAAVERTRKLRGSEAAMKQEVFRIAKERLGLDKPTAAQVAKVWAIKVGDLADKATLTSILEQEGVL